ncbi:unnamed protein product [Schistocephalus solidus]|uniref:MFS domain-containing protein n=1 Tax=Schistocephalus solidus TaxID=70667 RepID=A0A183T542_SCHSO|nr:unnamed protein product [Schistocephalus solidus]
MFSLRKQRRVLIIFYVLSVVSFGFYVGSIYTCQIGVIFFAMFLLGEFWAFSNVPAHGVTIAESIVDPTGLQSVEGSHLTLKSPHGNFSKVRAARVRQGFTLCTLICRLVSHASSAGLACFGVYHHVLFSPWGPRLYCGSRLRNSSRRWLNEDQLDPWSNPRPSQVVLGGGCLAALRVLEKLLQRFFQSGFLPLGFEYAAEITYPANEGLSSGLLNMTAHIIGIFLTLVSTVLINQYDGLAANLFMLVTMVLAAIPTFFLKDDLKRQRAQQKVKELSEPDLSVYEAV